jgi:ABC-type glycerol-3-phosphate transport system substrate-binding protein
MYSKMVSVRGKRPLPEKAGRPFFRGLCLLLAMTFVLTTFGGLSVFATDTTEEDAKKQALEEAIKEAAAKEGTYSAYFAEHEEKPIYSGEDIVIVGTDFIDTNMDVSNAIFAEFEGVKNVLLLKTDSKVQEEADVDATDVSRESAYVTYEVNIPQDGLYTMQVLYYPVASDPRLPVEGRGAQIERSIYIDGEIPFAEASYVTFTRRWKDEVPVGDMRDAVGNEMRPSQVEDPTWMTAYMNDARGYYSEPFLFYLTKGKHEIKIASTKEPMLLGELRIGASKAVPTYAEVKAQYEANGYQPAPAGTNVKIEAERPAYKSESSLYAYHSRASVSNSGVHGSFAYDHTQLNMIGGEKWETPGQWISWAIEVPESGLYTINMRARQNFKRGRTAARALTINGEAPFAEAATLEFKYSSDFEMVTLADDQGAPYEFYFEAGKTYEIKLMVVLGSASDIVRRADTSLAALMGVYRRMLRLVGNEPDKYRDYHFFEQMPHEMAMLKVQEGELLALADDLVEMAGERTSDYAMLQRIALSRLRVMYDREQKVAGNFLAFRDDLGSIAKWITDLTLQPLEIDYLYLAPAGSEMPKVNAGFFANMGHELKMFYYSFVTDYSTIGEEIDVKDAITVWFGTGAVGQVVGGGREQVQLLKQMIDDDFIPNHKIATNLQFIAMSALLPATLSGRGPDVALQIAGASDPVNYAMRGAVADLTQFDDFEEVKQRFFPSAMVQYTYLGGVYALPETQSFPILFYRTDILGELGLDVPNTWDDVKDMIPELQANNMGFGLQANINTFIMMIYQRSGGLYRGEGSDFGIASNLDSPEAIDAFINYTDMYRSYKLDISFDFQNRFRRGEMPIAVMDYTTYNMISLSAPEIRGLWKFALVPGLERVDENGNTYIDRSVAASGASCIMLQKSTKKEKAWEFMKWWTSTETQSRYAVEIESIIGTASRYPSANMEVMYLQPWSAEEARILNEQRYWAKGIPEVPGGYFTTRHMENAFKRVVNDVYDARETLLDYLDDINAELTNKRKEMGLTYNERFSKD